MLATELEVRQVQQNSQPFRANEVSALIGITGDLTGYVAIHCTSAQGAAFTGRLLGLPADEVVATDEIRDAIGELVNMVAGSVKTALSATHSLAIALPTVVMASKPDMRVKGATSTVVTFLDPTGEFEVELVVSDSENR